MHYTILMNRFLIEVQHEANKQACDRAITTFLTKGYHFFTNADWGCADGEHKAWIIVDLETKEEAMRIIPPEYRNQAKVVRLERFSMEDVDQTLTAHHG